MKTYSNVYDASGNALVLCDERSIDTIRMELRLAKNLTGLDYVVCQTPEEAFADAEKKEPAPTKPDMKAIQTPSIRQVCGNHIVWGKKG